MITQLPLWQDASYFGSFVACCAGQWLDARTTEVGLDNGLAEGNPIGKFLISHLGTTGMYVVKCAALPIASAVILGVFGFEPGVLVASTLAAFGLVAGIMNYRLLRKSSLSIF